MKNGQAEESCCFAGTASASKLRFSTTVVEKAIAAGPAGIRQAQRIALKHAKQHHEEAVDYWRKETSGDRFLRARARYALVWRPRFLSALSMPISVRLSARHAESAARWPTTTGRTIQSSRSSGTRPLRMPLISCTPEYSSVAWKVTLDPSITWRAGWLHPQVQRQIADRTPACVEAGSL